MSRFRDDWPEKYLRNPLYHVLIQILDSSLHTYWQMTRRSPTALWDIFQQAREQSSDFGVIN